MPLPWVSRLATLQEDHMVQLISGANDANLQLAGSSIGAVRAKFSTPLNIAANAQAQVNGSTENDDFILDEGDRLVFSRAAAEKGA